MMAKPEAGKDPILKRGPELLFTFSLSVGAKETTPGQEGIRPENPPAYRRVPDLSPVRHIRSRHIVCSRPTSGRIIQAAGDFCL